MHIGRIVRPRTGLDLRRRGHRADATTVRDLLHARNLPAFCAS